MCKGIACAVLFVNMFMGSAVLIEAHRDSQNQTCVHHSMSGECSMDMCPMKKNHASERTGLLLDCPTVEESVLFSSQYDHEGAVITFVAFNLVSSSTDITDSTSNQELVVRPPTPPPI